MLTPLACLNFSQPNHFLLEEHQEHMSAPEGTNEDELAMLQVDVQSGKRQFSVRVAACATLKQLKDQIQQETQIPQSLQKLMLRSGKTTLLKDDKMRLLELGVRDRAKITCIGSTLETVVAATSAVATPEKKKDVEKKPLPADASLEIKSLSQQKVGG